MHTQSIIKVSGKSCISATIIAFQKVKSTKSFSCELWNLKKHSWYITRDTFTYIRRSKGIPKVLDRPCCVFTNKKLFYKDFISDI